MANLDSSSKRSSSVGIALPFLFGAPFPPDGAFSQGDRQHMAFSYSGILAGVQTAPAFLEDLNTILLPHLDVLYAATPGDDYNTLLARDIPVVRADVDSLDQDLNTDYTKYLS